MPASCSTDIDYYAVLGLASSATIDQIRHAYRERAKATHPDRGGSHEQFIQVNLAYEVLSDPSLRATYDATRQVPRTPASDERWQRDSQRAATAAQEATYKYEQDPQQFDSWIDSLAKDFASAKFGSRPGFRMSEPTVSNSKSGETFIAWGKALGWAVAFIAMINLNWKDPKAPRNFLCLFSLPLVGAWAGRWAHGLVTLGLKRRATPAPMPEVDTSIQQQFVTSTCVCSQKLRVPVTTRALQVKCPKCHRLFGLVTTVTPPQEVCPKCDQSDRWDRRTCARCEPAASR